MVWVLVFLWIYLGAALWDAGRINRLYAEIAEPGPRKPAVELPPAPRLVIGSDSESTDHAARGVE